MQGIFVYGSLGDADVLAVVLGRSVPLKPAHLADHAILWGKDLTGSTLIPQVGPGVEGGLLTGLSEAEAARLEFYCLCLGYGADEVTVTGAEGSAVARVYRDDAGPCPLGRQWEQADWQSRLGLGCLATACDVMALYGVKPAAALRARSPLMLVRGAARVRAGMAPQGPRRLSGQVAVAARREPYARFFAVEEYDLSFQRFHGGQSETVTRAVFISGDAVTVLPYDPQRDRVLVVEQFRSGPFARGDALPWQIEAIAGRIDPGESPEDAARREAIEEAGLDLGALLPVAHYYPTPGICAEYLYSYVALTDLPDTAAGVFGVEGEAEDIRGHLVSFDDLMALIASGEVSNAPLILTAFWLQNNRSGLRRA